MANIISICGSLRKASYNAALARALPSLAPAGMTIKPAPPWDKFPIYNADNQNSSGFPADVTAWADAIRAADGVIIVSPEYNWSIPGGLKNAIDWVSRLKEIPFTDKPVALAILLRRSSWRFAHAIPSADGADHARCVAIRQAGSVRQFLGRKNSTRKRSR